MVNSCLPSWESKGAPPPFQEISLENHLIWLCLALDGGPLPILIIRQIMAKTFSHRIHGAGKLTYMDGLVLTGHERLKPIYTVLIWALPRDSMKVKNR